ncbi:MAG: bile acid:Na+ symporter [Bacteroidales bacterium]
MPWRTVKNLALPLAMLTGAAAHSLIRHVAFLTPCLIFIMLLLTFCKLSPRDVRVQPAHIYLLLIQLAGSLFIYALLRPYHPVLAQGAFICILAPTATAAAVITGMLGGNVAFITTHLLLCNVAAAFAAPLFFPLTGLHSEVSFAHGFVRIFRQTGALLLFPLLLAWLIRFFLPAVNRKITTLHNLSFYLWVFALTIVTGRTVGFLIEQETAEHYVEIRLAGVSFILCVCQFLWGRRIGRRYGDAVACGQALGQKNSILAIWMTQTYLNPIASVAPAVYILWQNIINSCQLWLRNKNTQN